MPALLLLVVHSLPPLRGGQLLATTFNAVPVTLLVAALVLYLWGVRRVNRLQPRHRWSRWRTAAWIGALASTLVAVSSFIGVYQSELFYDHMVQHLLLVMVASPLLALGAPVRLAWRATTGDLHAGVTRILRSAPATALGHPIVAYGVYALLIPLTHLTSFYNYTVEHPGVDDLEHLVYLVVGYLFWRQIFVGEPNRYQMFPGLRIAYLGLAIPVDTFTGLSLASATHELFPAYLHLYRTWGPTLVQDIHTGGALMWVVGDTLMFVPMIPLALQWVRYDERRARRADRELEAVLPATSVFGTLPGPAATTSRPVGWAVSVHPPEPPPG